MAASEGTTLREAAREYLAGLSDDDRVASQGEVEKFVRWCGGDRTFDQLRGHEVASYADTLAGSVTDATARADAVRKFLAGVKKAGHSATNLGAHLRVKKTSGRSSVSTKTNEVEMSNEEHVALTAELESLKAQRPQIVADIKRAMEDKDFRENAPLDAAKQQQGHVEGRIQNIEARLANAVIDSPDRARSGHVVEVGSTVVLRNMKSDAQVTYTLVRPGEVEAAKGRISFESPVGQALLMKGAGDEVDVTAPSGMLRFRIESVEG